MSEMASKPVSPIGRVSYPYVFNAQENKNEDGSIRKSYSVVLLFDKTADLSAMKAEYERVKKEYLAKEFKGKEPPGFKNPFRDGDEKNFDGNSPEYAGMTYISFRAQENRKPQVVDAALRQITQESGQFYAGCYAKVSFSCYGYNTKGNKGVAFSLGNIQKVRDGEPLDGRTTAENDFEAVDDSAALF